MDPKQKKKIENFKKEIKRQAFEKKKIEIRKQLPYYKEMFRQNDESSNATNSRSSRFPIKSGSSKEKSQTFLQNKTQEKNLQQPSDLLLQKQLEYLQYLKNLNSSFSEEDKVFVERSLALRYGQRCFQDIQETRAKIYFDLLTYQASIYQKQSQIIAHEQFTGEDWNFVVASFKIGQNENFEQISRSAFILITTLFNQWYLNMMKKSIMENRGQSIEGFFDKMKQLSSTQIRVQEIILSRLMETCQGQIDTQVYLLITKYFLDRINLFEHIERTLVKYYEVEETENFAELIYNFGFVHAMEILAYMSQSQQIDISLRVSMFNVVNRYFSMYPFEVQSETQTRDKFNQFIDFYLNNLISFYQQLENEKTPNLTIQYDDPLHQFLRSSMMLITSLMWRETQQSCNYQVYKIYLHLINICLTTDGLLVRVQQFKDLHIRMAEFSLSFSALIKNGKILFKQNAYLQYVNLLTLYFHEFKLKFRNNLPNCSKQNLSMSQVQQLLALQSFMIYAIYVINNISLNGQDGQVNQDVQRLLQYTEFVYRKQHHTLQICGFQIQQSFYLIFNSNVKLYFRLILNPAKFKIPNPQNEQNHSQYPQQIEI